MRTDWNLAASLVIVFGFAIVAMAVRPTAGNEQAPPAGPREVPARTLPVPDTVSPEMQKLVAAPPQANWNDIPKTPEEWNAIGTRRGNSATLAAMRERLGVKLEPTTVNGVKAYMLTPHEIAPENRNRLLLHVHGGCYMLQGGEAGTTEGVLMAAYGRYKVLSVDYRMPPAQFYPAALDDVVEAWKGAMKMSDPKRMAIFGLSAGGALTLSTIHRLKQDGLPLPAAIAPGTPMSDLTGAGDSFHANFMVDNVLVGIGRCDAMAEYYAHGHDLKDPMLSPIYGDMHGFPPTILTTGTRDLLLSSTVRVHRKLRQSGVEAVLQVFEAQSHAQYNRETPEGREAFEEIARFFDKHLAQ